MTEQVFLIETNYIKNGSSLSSEAFPKSYSHLDTMLFARTFLYVQVTVGKKKSLYVRWTERFLLVKSLVKENRALRLYFDTPKL